MRGLLMVLLFSCLLHPLYAQTFQDASHLLGENDTGFALGGSAVDYDNDGRVDLYTSGRLYRNEGANGFKNLAEEAGLINEGETIFGGIFGDYDNDGLLDLFIEDLSAPSNLYRNLGNLRFDQTNQVSQLNTAGIPVQGSAWGDFNNDGKLDLFVGSDNGDSRLFENIDFQTFADRSEGANLLYERNVYGVAVSDYDRDGDQDIFLAPCNSAIPSLSQNILLRNNGDMTFTNIASAVGVGDNLSSWGVVWIDYDNDGWQDLYIANMSTNDGRSAENRMYKNNRRGGFFQVNVNVSDLEDESFGVAAADFDNDGWTDLYVVNQNQHRFYRNNADGTGFTNTYTDSGVDTRDRFGVAVADLNNDGWIDLYFPQDDKLFMNEGGSHHWLKVQTRGTSANHFGIGARVEVYVNGQIQVREITAGDGMTAQNHNLTAHFGLGTAMQVDSVIVRWPGGAMDRLGVVVADQTVTVVEGLGINQQPAPFHLHQPGDGGRISVQTPVLEFEWEAATDAAGEAVTYTFYLNGAGVDQEITGLTSPRVQINASQLPIEEPLVWSVSATDGYSRRSSLDRFTVIRSMATDRERVEAVAAVALEAYPNPFGQAATVRFTVREATYTTVHIYDVLGRKVRTVAKGTFPAGTHTRNWDAQDEQGRRVAPGLYYARIHAGETVVVKALVHSP